MGERGGRGVRERGRLLPMILPLDKVSGGGEGEGKKGKEGG
jgi:hypothetical protein